MVIMALFLKDVEPIMWLFPNPSSVTDTKQVKTGLMSMDGFYFWLLGYLHFVGLDMDKISMLCFQFPINQKTFKEFYFVFNTDIRCFGKDAQFLSWTFWLKIVLFPVFLLVLLVAPKIIGIWESSAAEIPTRAGPHCWVLCPGATIQLWDGVCARSRGRAAVEPGEPLPMERGSPWAGCNPQNTKTQELGQALDVLAEL